MEVKKSQIVTLWDGQQGMVIGTTDNSAHIKLESGKHVYAAFDQIVAAVDTFTEKEAKFLAAKDKLSAFKGATKKTAKGPIVPLNAKATDNKGNKFKAAVDFFTPGKPLLFLEEESGKTAGRFEWYLNDLLNGSEWSAPFKGDAISLDFGQNWSATGMQAIIKEAEEAMHNQKLDATDNILNFKGASLKVVSSTLPRLATPVTEETVAAWAKAMVDAGMEYHLDDDPADIEKGNTGKPLFTPEQIEEVKKDVEAIREADILDVAFRVFLDYEKVASKKTADYATCPWCGNENLSEIEGGECQHCTKCQTTFRKHSGKKVECTAYNGRGGDYGTVYIDREGGMFVAKAWLEDESRYLKVGSSDDLVGLKNKMVNKSKKVVVMDEKSANKTSAINMRILKDEIKNGILPQGYEIKESDVGQRVDSLGTGSFGQVLPSDVGKRIFLKPYGIAMENNEQRDARKNKGVTASIEVLSPGRVDESKWKKAEEAIAKSTGKSKSDFSDSEWAQVNSVYQNMGGKFKSKEAAMVGKNYSEKTVEGTVSIPIDGLPYEVSYTATLKFAEGDYARNVNDEVFIEEDTFDDLPMDLFDDNQEMIEEKCLEDAYAKLESKTKTAALPADEGSPKYPVGTILVTEDNPQSPECGFLHVLKYDAKEEIYTLNKRPMNDVEAEKDDQLQGVRFEMSKKELEGDKELRVFAANSFKAGDRVVVSPNAGLNSLKEGVIADRSEITTDGRGTPTNVEGAYKPVDWSKEVAIRLEDGQYITMYKMLVKKLPKDGEDRFNGDRFKLFHEGSIEAGKPSALTAVKQDGYNVVLSFKEFDATYTKEGTLVSTAATAEQFSEPYRKEFGLMVKNIGFDKLSTVMAKKRIASKLMVLSDENFENNKGFEVVFDSREQSYGVYKDGKLLRTTYDRKAAESYLEAGGTIKTAATNDEVINMFVSDSFPKDKMPEWGTPNLKIVKKPNGWALVNYATPLAYRNASGDVYVNENKYSNTTTIIQKKLFKALTDSGIAVDTMVDADNIDMNGKEAGVDLITEATQRIASKLRKLSAEEGAVDISEVKQKAKELGLKVTTQTLSWGPHATVKDTKSDASTKGNVFSDTPEAKDFIARLNSLKEWIAGRKVTSNGEKVRGLTAAKNIELSKYAMTKIASLRKKAERLGNYDFDIHGGTNWKLEACEDGKQKLKRVTE